MDFLVSVRTRIRHNRRGTGRFTENQPRGHRPETAGGKEAARRPGDKRDQARRSAPQTGAGEDALYPFNEREPGFFETDTVGL
ncbi:MAG: hypothetical protein LBQ88_12350 [Treponema sp.]|nr:hypothetical protein [Treponema sp.]